MTILLTVALTLLIVFIISALIMLFIVGKHCYKYSVIFQENIKIIEAFYNQQQQYLNSMEENSDGMDERPPIGLLSE